MGKTKQNKEYYAVVKGRVDRPIIFSSWGDVHPRVTGCHSEYSSFYTIDDARAYMSKKGVEDAEEVIKDGAGETTPLPDGPIYYAVAYGSQPGIYPFWHGSMGSEEKVKGVSGACYKTFRTYKQAQAFIEDWNESFAHVWQREIRAKLDQGFRPRDMRLTFEGMLDKPKTAIQGQESLCDKLETLLIKEEY